jgi:hypothetical protein
MRQWDRKLTVNFASPADKMGAQDPQSAKSLKRNGAIWVVYPKGKKEITEIGVLKAGRQAGLVDTKVARFLTPLAKR